MAPIKEVFKVDSFDLVIKDFENVYNQVRLTSLDCFSCGKETHGFSVAGAACHLCTEVYVCSNGTIKVVFLPTSNSIIKIKNGHPERCRFRGTIHFFGGKELKEAKSSVAIEPVTFCAGQDNHKHCYCEFRGSKCPYGGLHKEVKRILPIGEDIPATATIRVELEFLPFKDEPADSTQDENSILKGNLGALRDTKYADVKMICNEKVFWAHKVILSARSDVFEALFSHKDTKEDKSGEVHIEDCDHEAMEMFLSYIYEGSAPPQDISLEVAKQLLNVANKYNFPSLKEKSARILLAHLNEDNAFQIAQLGRLYDIESLKKAAMATLTASGKDLIDLIHKSGFRLQEQDE